MRLPAPCDACSSSGGGGSEGRHPQQCAGQRVAECGGLTTRIASRKHERRAQTNAQAALCDTQRSARQAAYPVDVPVAVPGGLGGAGEFAGQSCAPVPAGFRRTRAVNAAPRQLGIRGAVPVEGRGGPGGGRCDVQVGGGLEGEGWRGRLVGTAVQLAGRGSGRRGGYGKGLHRGVGRAAGGPRSLHGLCAWAGGGVAGQGQGQGQGRGHHGAQRRRVLCRLRAMAGGTDSKPDGHRYGRRAQGRRPFGELCALVGCAAAQQLVRRRQGRRGGRDKGWDKGWRACWRWAGHELLHSCLNAGAWRWGSLYTGVWRWGRLHASAWLWVGTCYMKVQLLQLHAQHVHGCFEVAALQVQH